jgi:NAD(P)-dependent dehydrogenase (short-subunit alcohol dehydrogenase family)
VAPDWDRQWQSASFWKARVVVVEISASDGEATVQDIQWSGGDSILVEADVSQEQDVKAMVAQATHRYGGVDILYHNAAVLCN